VPGGRPRPERSWRGGWQTPAAEADDDDTEHVRGDKHGAVEHAAEPHDAGRPSLGDEGDDGGERVGRAVAEREERGPGDGRR